MLTQTMSKISLLIHFPNDHLVMVMQKVMQKNCVIDNAKKLIISLIDAGVIIQEKVKDEDDNN